MELVTSLGQYERNVTSYFEIVTIPITAFNYGFFISAARFILLCTFMVLGMTGEVHALPHVVFF